MVWLKMIGLVGKNLTDTIGKKVQLVGDDLFCNKCASFTNKVLIKA